ncbi:hypothetical protein EV359DRAFT_78940 [Lentinula novae-zelandiae]|nr:hypothetical protein EV359DRAFT_78940 [Lentinula novae-zelandiae]
MTRKRSSEELGGHGQETSKKKLRRKSPCTRDSPRVRRASIGTDEEEIIPPSEPDLTSPNPYALRPNISLKSPKITSNMQIQRNYITRGWCQAFDQDVVPASPDPPTPSSSNPLLLNLNSTLPPRVIVDFFDNPNINQAEIIRQASSTLRLSQQHYFPMQNSPLPSDFSELSVRGSSPYFNSDTPIQCSPYLVNANIQNAQPISTQGTALECMKNATATVARQISYPSIAVLSESPNTPYSQRNSVTPGQPKTLAIKTIINPDISSSSNCTAPSISIPLLSSSSLLPLLPSPFIRVVDHISFTETAITSTAVCEPQPLNAESGTLLNDGSNYNPMTIDASAPIPVRTTTMAAWRARTARIVIARHFLSTKLGVKLDKALVEGDFTSVSSVAQDGIEILGLLL